MGTIVWLIFTTAVGWVIGNFAPTEAHPFLGAVIGFGVGVVLRIIVASGSSGALDDIGDIIGDIVD